MTLARRARRLRHRAGALAVAAMLVSAPACGSDDEDSQRTAPATDGITSSTEAPAPSEDSTSTTTEASPTEAEEEAPARFEVTGFEPATGELRGTGDASGLDGGGTAVVDESTRIVVQGPDGPEDLPVAQLGGWLRQRLIDLGATADAVPMEITYTPSGDKLRVRTLTEIPPG